MREIALSEIVGVIRSHGGKASVSEIMEATGRSRGNVDSYLQTLEKGKHVIRGIRRTESTSGPRSWFEYSAPEGQVAKLPGSDEVNLADANCRTTPDGGCVGGALTGKACMHDPPVSGDYNQIEQRDLAFQAAQVINESKSGPIPAYESQTMGTPPVASENLIECGPCSEAGGADRGAVHHTAPACPSAPRSAPSAEELIGRARARDWRPGFTHLTKGGEFELREDGDGRTSVRRLGVDAEPGNPVQISTSDALAMFIPANKADGVRALAKMPDIKTWITPAPAPPTMSKPRPRNKGADDLGHFGEGSKAAASTDKTESE